jgi:biopolymer transport protein ExbB
MVCSVLALALVIERLLQLRTRQVAPEHLLEQVLELTRQGIPDPRQIGQIERRGLLGQVLSSALRTLQEHPDASPEQLRASLEMAGRLAALRLERYLSALATIASAAPLLGLLGTVVGMIEIFGAQSPQGAQQPAQLAHGISVALYNTAFGLVVAIPTLMFWRYFRSTVDRHVLTLEIAAERFARHLDRLRG